MSKRFWVIGILVLAFFGLADSAYLARHEAAGTPLICNIESLSDCNIVAASEYSKLFGISIAQYGVIFYSIIIVLAALELAVFDRLLRRALQTAALVGVIASAYFTLLQVFVIEALCVYCLASAVIALLILVAATLIEPVRTRGSGGSGHEPPEDLRMPPLP